MRITATEVKMMWSEVFEAFRHTKNLESQFGDFWHTVNQINTVSERLNKPIKVGDDLYFANDYEIASPWKDIILPFKVVAYKADYAVDLRSESYYNKIKSDSIGTTMTPFAFKSFQTALFQACRVKIDSFINVETLRTIATLDDIKSRLAVFKPVNPFTGLVSPFFEPIHFSEFKVMNTAASTWPIVVGVQFEADSQYMLDGHKVMLKYIVDVFNGSVAE